MQSETNDTVKEPQRTDVEDTNESRKDWCNQHWNRIESGLVGWSDQGLTGNIGMAGELSKDKRT